MKRINFKTTLMTGLFVLLGMVAKADNNPIVAVSYTHLTLPTN